MSIKKQEKNKPINSKINSVLEGWDAAIADAKERIERLKFSIEIFERNKREGVPWQTEK